MEGMEEDYKPIPALDAYEATPADYEEPVQPMTIEERKAAERALDERDRERYQGGRRAPVALYEELDEPSDDELLKERQKRRQYELEHLGTVTGTEEDGQVLDMEDIRGSTTDWLRQPRTSKWIRKNFNTFLRSYRDEAGIAVYEERIKDMCTNNRQSLEVTYMHLSEKSPTLALWVAEQPAIIIPILNEVVFSVVSELFPSYGEIHSDIFVRIRDLPVEDKLRDLRQVHLRGLVKIRGVVTKRTGVFPQLKKMFFVCTKCGDRKGPFLLASVEEISIGSCGICQSAGPFALDQGPTVYRNYQKITVQETPGSVPAGRVPRQKEVILLDDNIDSARPGDEVEITGVYTHHFDYGMNIKHGFPVFSTLIEANHVRRLGEMEVTELTEEDKIEIRALGKQNGIGQRIIASIAPSIYGHNFIKTALALAMFGGVPKDVAGKHKIRGDLNVLLLGDPGTAKSQFLKYIEKAVHRCVYTTGKGASAVGLTAGVRRDPMTKEWTLEGGALVLADKGICLIDEFDKMNDKDRTSIHEAMEQQSISISKAGIVTSLQARCSVIAAANPLGGKYDSQKTFYENVDLTDPILSRFDILCVIKDEIDAKADLELATFVINSHIKCHPEAQEEAISKSLLEEPMAAVDIISQDLLKKYVLYAKRFIHPKLADIDKDRVTQFYTELRKEASVLGGLPIGVRHVESVLRMAESNARMHLREYVREDDVILAIKMMLESFLMSQKYAVGKALGKRFARYLVKERDSDQLLLQLLDRMIRDKMKYMQLVQIATDLADITISRAQFEQEARDMGVPDATKFLNSEAFKSRFMLQKNLIKLKQQQGTLFEILFDMFALLVQIEGIWKLKERCVHYENVQTNVHSIEQVEQDQSRLEGSVRQVFFGEGDVLFHSLLLGHSSLTFPGLPLGLIFWVEHSGLWDVYVTYCGLLEECVDFQSFII
eukprot:TRINITY_DN934_c0_g1_i1.p1 TRINITY_DN934_c0_g1~~TRINITY_DN934_c0_g1_i1.p1  ORF type:complete len:943 (-),score=83.79 TRINITY_DN934_c0_g1_i1:196-3024(-)